VRRFGRPLIAAVIIVLLGSVLTGVVATELALHSWRRHVPRAAEASAVANESGSAWEAVQISAADGAVLRAWLFTPPAHDGSAVLVLHGVNDTRESMLKHARYLLRSGFVVLMPDLRGHGESGGAITTYGIAEAGDIGRWADWLDQTHHVKRLYGLGMSLGGAVLLQSLGESRFRAVAAESPFASFQEIAYDRLSQMSRVDRHVFWPVIQSGFLYARVRYGLDLRRASPAAAVASCHTPILLIHGASDQKTPIRHSRELHAINPDETRLWEVAGARHTGAMNAQPEQYPRIVVEWFRSHP
jgi:dipeptidyl aminopeptidase/acylaminoacyl peptidase